MTLRHSLARLGASALLALGALAGTAHAAGTVAGTDINNSATLNFTVGGITQTGICSSPTGNSTSTCTNTTFKVDNKINLLVTTTDSAPGVSAVPGSSSTLTFVVTNQGNSTQNFSLSTITNLSGSLGNMFGSSSTTVTDTFDPTSCTIYKSSDTTTAITSLANVAPDGFVNLSVVCAIPLGKTNTDVAAVALKATATEAGTGNALTQSPTNDPTVVDIVFADIAGSDDGARDASHSARSAFKVSTAAIQVTKTFVTLCDPAGGDGLTTYVPKSIPGAYVQYTVTIANNNTAGSVAAVLTNVTDALDVAKVTFDSELITGANAATNTPGCASTTSTPIANRGTATSSGNAFKVTWTGTATRTSFGSGTSGTKYLVPATNYTAPNINVNWSSVLPAEDSYATAGQLKPGETVKLIFNVIIN